MTKLVVVIPALNEGATIANVVSQVPRAIEGIDTVEVVVIDDGSTDGTAEKARNAGAHVVSHERNKGLGVAFATGVRTALSRAADVAVNMDGDGQFNPADIPTLIAPIVSGEAGFVTCSRFAEQAIVPTMPAVKLWGNRRMTGLINSLCATDDFTDVSCGFRAYSRETLLRLNLYGRYTYTQETFINLAAQDVTMHEVPLEVRGVREFGESRVANDIIKYIMKTVPIITRSVRDVRPLLFFGVISFIVTLIGVALGAFVLWHWSQTGRTHPYQSVLIGSAVGLILGFLVLVLAMLADMLNRVRRQLEELLYLARRERYEKPK